MNGRSGYAALGLARNPFLAEDSSGVEAALWVERGVAPPSFERCSMVQLIGPRGAGKTSLLLHWRERWPGPYHYVPLGAARWCVPPSAPVAYWDELDRLPAPLLWLALRRARRLHATLVVGTHRDLGAAARAAGFAVRTHRFAPLDAAVLGAWAARRIARAALFNTAPALALDAATAQRVASIAGASWRAAGDLLHTWAAEQAAHATDDH